MINPQELRIGNYIKEYNIGVLQVGIVDVESISRGDTNYQPIELNEEWLLKLGFQKEENYSFELDDISINTSREMMWIHTKCKNIAQLEMPHYIHELQNIYFALSNKELILNTTV